MEKPLRRWAWGAIFHGSVPIGFAGAVEAPQRHMRSTDIDAPARGSPEVKPCGVLQRQGLKCPGDYETLRKRRV